MNNFRVTGANDSFENYAYLFTIGLRNDDIQEFDSKWDALSGNSHAPGFALWSSVSESSDRASCCPWAAVLLVIQENPELLEISLLYRNKSPVNFLDLGSTFSCAMCVLYLTQHFLC